MGNDTVRNAVSYMSTVREVVQWEDREDARYYICKKEVWGISFQIGHVGAASWASINAK